MIFPQKYTSPGKTDSMYQVMTPYRKVSNIIMTADVVMLKPSSSNGLSKKLSHWTPTPCSSNRAKYSQPKPKATGDSRLWKWEAWTHTEFFYIYSPTSHLSCSTRIRDIVIWKVQVPQTITVLADTEWQIWSRFQEAWNLYWTSTQNC